MLVCVGEYTDRYGAMNSPTSAGDGMVPDGVVPDILATPAKRQRV